MGLSKDDALAIAKKLKAMIVTRRKAHDLAQVWYRGKVIAMFGIRRGSRRDSGHGHIPPQVFLRPKQAQDLADCPMSRDDWLEQMERLGKLN